MIRLGRINFAGLGNVGEGKGEDEGPVLDEILSGGMVMKGEEDGAESEGVMMAVVGTVCRGSTSVVRMDVSYNADIGVAGEPVVQQFIDTAKDDLMCNKLNGIDIVGCRLSIKRVEECCELIRAVRAECAAGEGEENGGKKDDKKKKKKK